MNKKRIIIVVVLVVIALALSLSIFMGGNSKYKEDTINYMMSAIESKYNQKFAFVDITTARNKTYTNTNITHYNIQREQV